MCAVPVRGSTPVQPPPLSLIAAVDRAGAIGKGGELLWSNSDDQKHFRATTQGHAVLMGRKTWDSLPPRFRPLPGRRNIVLTRDIAWQADGAEVAHSFDAALSLLGTDPSFVIGGAEIYALALPFARRLVLTEVDAVLGGDTHFPQWDPTHFYRGEPRRLMDPDGTAFEIATYTRI